ncbi:hypothetical protein IZY60_06150 [Lutibacter sp. B2]|nr:hypothetical protein [Lutibacter sp. B2]
MANPLAKNIMANIANQMKVQRDTSHENHKEMDSKYEGLLKDVIHKKVEKKEERRKASLNTMKLDDYLDHFNKVEKKEEKIIEKNEKRKMTLEDFGNLLTGGVR